MDTDVIEVEVKGVMPTSSGCAVFLGNDEKVFVIYVDPGIGAAITRAAKGERLERPQSHDLIGFILTGLGARLERMLINDVQEATYFARIYLSMENELGRKLIEIDARPSDAIVLTIMAEQPILATRKVFDAVDDMREILQRILDQQKDDE